MYRIIAAAALAACVVLPSAAGAAIFTDRADQTRDGERFAFRFEGAPDIAPGAEAVLTLLARGDYTPGFGAWENLNLRMESALNVPNLGPDTVGILARHGYDDVLWQASFSVAHADMLRVLRDQVIEVTVDLARHVDVFRGARPFVEVSVSYRDAAATPVPTPGVPGLLGLGLGALGVMLWRRRSS